MYAIIILAILYILNSKFIIYFYFFYKMINNLIFF